MIRTKIINLKDAAAALKSDPQKAYSLYNQAYYHSELDDDQEIQGKSLLGLAHASRNMGEIGKGFKYANKALSLYQETGDPEGIIRSYNFMGIFKFHSGLNQSALEHFFTAENLMAKNEVPAALSVSVLNNIAEVYANAEDAQTSLQFYKKAYSSASAAELSLYEHSILSNMGKVHQMIYAYAQAEGCFRKALSHLDHSGDRIFISEAHLSLAQVLFAQGKKNEAHEHLDHALAALSGLENTHYYIDALTTQAQFSTVYSSDRQEFLLKALELAEKSEARKKEMDLLKTLSSCEEAAGNPGHALDYYKRYHQVESDLNASQLRFQMEILLSKHHPNILDNQLEKLRNLLSGEMDSNSLTRKAHYDELTTLPNRYLIKMMLEYLQRNKTRQCWLGILDLDHFKWVNDGMGHLFGDECLIQIANQICQDLIAYDGFVGRFGGEEFLILLPEINRIDGAQILENLLEKVRLLDIIYQYEGQDHLLTASIGATYIENVYDNWNELLEEADQALYRAKASGRNRMLIWNN